MFRLTSSRTRRAQSLRARASAELAPCFAAQPAPATIPPMPDRKGRDPVHEIFLRRLIAEHAAGPPQDERLALANRPADDHKAAYPPARRKALLAEVRKLASPQFSFLTAMLGAINSVGTPGDRDGS